MVNQLPMFAGTVIDRDLADEMRDSFVPYALSVMLDRALPDVRDGLKPVQRRILYTAHLMGLQPGTKTRKSARLVGSVMGQFHPHGDSAVYEALVRMGQPHSMRVPLIDPQGNFGSLDDAPAAARYTECRLSEAAAALLAEIGEDTVDFVANFDGELQEPTVLPAAFPNLLVNGSSGIAVGLATSIPPHNLGEVRDVIQLLMTQRRPKPSVADVLELMPGPDFPGGGIVVRDDDFESVYATGRGTIKVRARAVIDKVASRRQGIVVTELPYLIGPERVVAAIQDAVETGKLPGVADVKNLSDRNGVRIQVTCKVGVDPEVVLTDLYRLTPMETSVKFNANVLVDGLPRQVGVIEMCDLFIAHRLDVIVRRTRHRLGRAEDRLHVVKGLLKALDAIDRVVKIIRAADDVAAARTELMSVLRIDAVQADHILELQLRRLAKLEKQKLVAERDLLVSRVGEYKRLLGSEQRQRTVLLKELDQQVDRIGTDRVTTVLSVDQVPVADTSVMVDAVDEPCLVELSTSGLVGRSPGPRPHSKPGRHDLLVSKVSTSTLSTLLTFTSTGSTLRFQPVEVPEMRGRSRGTKVVDLFGLGRSEQVVSVAASPGSGSSLLVVTAEGRGKRITSDEFDQAARVDRCTVFGFRSDTDQVVAVVPVNDGDEVVMVTAAGQVLRCSADAAPVQGLTAGGSLIMNVEDSRIVAAGAARSGTVVAAVTDAGTAKVVAVDDIPSRGSRGSGTKLGRFRRTETGLVAAVVGPADVLGASAGDTDPEPVAASVAVTERAGVYDGEVEWTTFGVMR